MIPPWIPLDEVGPDHAPLVGRKAAVLAALRRAGFAVPDGFCVPVGTDARETAAELSAAFATLGGPVAVRSSGVAEDGTVASYAGQLVTTLDVCTPGTLIAAVVDGQASGDRAGVHRYRRDRDTGTDGERGVAILVQRMVEPVSAGVAFTVNPVTGADELVVDAVPGLADEMVSGLVDPDHWVVRGGRPEQLSGTHGALDTETAARVAELATAVARHLGGPQDIEWAVDKEQRLWLLQARPVTTLPTRPGRIAAAAPDVVPIDVVVPPGFWRRDPYTTTPWVPMQESVFGPVFNATARHMVAFSLYGLPCLRQIGGWPYHGRAADDETDEARWDRFGKAILAGEYRRVVQRWHHAWRAEFAARTVELRSVDLSTLPQTWLAAHLLRVRVLFADLHEAYFRVAGAGIVALGELGVLCRDLLGWDAAQTIRLAEVSGAPRPPASVALDELASVAAGRPALCTALLGAVDPRAGSIGVEQLADVDPDFATRFATHIAAYGHRTMGFDLSEPTVAERPGIVLAMLRSQIGRTRTRAAGRRAEPTAPNVRAEAARVLEGAPSIDRERFNRALEACDATAGLRDEKSARAVEVWALLRYAVRAAGDRLAVQGRIAVPDDALYLHADELETVMRDPAAPLPDIAQRQAQRRWARQHPGPPVHGTFTPPPPVDPARLSEPARYALDVVGWSMSAWTGGRRPDDTGDRVLRGVGVSPGRYAGTVRVVAGAHEFDKVRPGDVVVCTSTTPQWNDLFSAVGALVTDTGGLLSHPAIVAREYGVPAVVATGRGTRSLRDDQVVTVDGDTGEVTPVPLTT
ncbi:MAG TPA: PEP/pyruvate-binding domain-containing protein [Rugosimonospora sp.]|nr:PEP/pyruvate-binding domain-containing protein [Rugosimonospora sp.]